MLKRLSRKRKEKKEKQKSFKKVEEKGLLKKINLETNQQNLDEEEEEEKIKQTSVIDASDLDVDESGTNLFISKDESINAIVNSLLDSLEELVTDEKIFEISQVVREDVEKQIQKLITHLESRSNLLKDDEFIYNRLSVLTKSLGDLVEATQHVNEFETLLLSLNTLLSQSLINKIKDSDDSSIDLSKANLLEIEEPIKKGEEVVTYVDNRDHDIYSKSTSVISEEQLREIEEAEKKEKAKIKKTKINEAQEYLDQSAKIREALKEKSTYLISGKFRYLSMDERLEIEKEQFKSKFLSYMRKPSVYEMSVYELQRFASQKGLKNFEGMSRDELLAFVENPLRLYGEKYITQNPYINRLKIELADNAALKDDILLAESKINESLKAAKAYSKNVRASAITWQAFFIITLILVAAAIVGILVYFLAF